MLTELHISNFAIIDRVDLSFSSGFNVLTGETGAGKSIIIDAVDMLLGGKAGQEVIRAGETITEVEGVFSITPQVADVVNPVLEREGLEGDDPDTLVLSRELRRGGRSVARINGRAVAMPVLKEIGDLIVDIHGQTDHLSLMRQKEHVNLLDRYAGLMSERDRIGAEVRRLLVMRKELGNLRRDQRELVRRIDLLTFQVEEIDGAALQAGEDEALEGERRRLANAEQLIRLTEAARRVLDEGDDQQTSAMDFVSEAAGKLAKLAAIDPDAASLLEAAEALADQLSDLIHAVESYAGEVEFNPERLAEVEERLSLIFNLKRKYGDSIDDIIAFGQRACAELDELSNAEVRTAELEAEETKLLDRIGSLGATLSKARRGAAARMATEVIRELADLRMERAHFDVEFQWHADTTGAVVGADEAPDSIQPGCYRFDASGLDRIEFLVSANPGEPLKPLVKVASGGETSRLMLALKTVLGRADRTPTLIFDEIDVGIGGRVGATVGRKLWELTARKETREPKGQDTPQPKPSNPETLPEVRHQVLCITHLPQLAGYGDVHFAVRKVVVDQRTRTELVNLAGQERVSELAAMQGSNSDAGRISAEEMLAEVALAKARF